MPNHASVILLNNRLPSTSQSNGRNIEIEVFHNSMKRILQLLDSYMLSRYLITQCENVWICHPDVASYCCDNPEFKNIASMKYVYSTYHCICCLTIKRRFSVYDVAIVDQEKQ